MKRILFLAVVVTLAITSAAVAQCPNGRCGGTSFGFGFAPRFAAPRYAAPRYYAPRVYAAPVYRAPGFFYSSPNRSFGFGSGGFYYGQGRCLGGRCR